MNLFKKSGAPLAVVLSCMAWATGGAHAQSNPFSGAECLGSKNTVCVQEISYTDNGRLTGQYQMSNYSGQQIFMFGVTNSDAKGAYSTTKKESVVFQDTSWFEYRYNRDTGEYDEVWVSSSMAVPYLSYWQGITITKDEWNSSTHVFGAFMAEAYNKRGARMFEVTSAQLGQFETVFGTEDTSVNLYWHVQGSNSNAFTTGTLNGFYWNDSPVKSQFTAFGTNGNIVATSVSAVPEPETYLMFAAGLGLLRCATRRQKS